MRRNTVKYLFTVISIVLIGYLNKPLEKTSAQLPRIYKIAWSPNGNLIGGASSDGLRIWDANTRDHMFTFGVQSGISDLAWSPNSATVVGAGWDGLVYVWDVADEMLLETFDWHSEHNDTISSVTWNSDGTRIISQGLDGGVAFWDASTYDFLYSIEGASGYSVSVSPDNQLLASGNFRAVNIRNALTGAYITSLEGHMGEVFTVEWSPDGNKLVSGSADGTVRIWDVAQETLLLTLEGHTNYVQDATWSPGGEFVVSTDLDGNRMVWDSTTGQLLVNTPNTSSLASWSPDSRWIAYNDFGEVKYFDTNCIIAPGDGSVPVMRTPCDVVSDSIWPTYSWWAADGADWYNIYVGDAATHTQNPFGLGGVWLEAAQVCNGDICEFRPVDGLDDTSPSIIALTDNTYDWSIRSFDSSTGVLGDWQPNQAFEVVNPVPTIVDPVTFALTGFPTYTWTPVPDADAYQLWVGGQDSTTLIDTMLPATDVCDEQQCQYQSRDGGAYLAADQHNGLYGWYVRPYYSNASLYGEWEGTTLFTPVMTPVALALDTSTPVLNLAGRQAVTLTWQQGAFEEFYKVWISDAAQQEVFNMPFAYYEDMCDDEGICSLTVYFDGAGRNAYLGTMNGSLDPFWSAAHQLTVIESSQPLVVAQPPTVSGVTINGVDTDSSTTDEFVPPSTSLPPANIHTYPELCTDNPLCDSPFGEE